jgi:hypothetical protein
MHDFLYKELPIFKVYSTCICQQKYLQTILIEIFNCRHNSRHTGIPQVYCVINNLRLNLHRSLNWDNDLMKCSVNYYKKSYLANENMLGMSLIPGD